MELGKSRKRKFEERLIPRRSIVPERESYYHDFDTRIDFKPALPKLRELYKVDDVEDWQGLKIHLTKIVDEKVEIHMVLSTFGQLALISPEGIKEDVYKHFDFLCELLDLYY